MLQRCTRLIASPYLWGVILLLGLDQASKWIILSYPLMWPRPLTSFLNIVFVKNRGISFGILNTHSQPVFWGLTGLITAIILYMIYLLYKARNNIMRWGFCFVLGGAIGNLLDRFLHKGVVDFMDFHLWSIHWPAFNFADSFIFIGTVLLLKNSLKETK